MSIRVVSEIGFPASSVSRRAKSSRFFSIRSPSRQSTLPRSAAENFAHGPSKAARAARTARSMSAASPSEISAIDSPVAGLTVEKRLPETASRHSAPIRRRPPDASSAAGMVSLGFMKFLRLARVLVDAAPHFAAQPPGFHVLDEERVGAEPLAERAMQVFQDAEARVQA